MAVEPLSGAAIAGIVTVATGLVTGLIELCKYTVGAAMNKKTEEKDQPTECGLTDDQHSALFFVRDKINVLSEMHNKFDQDGTPLWYVPRSWASIQKDILNCVKTVAHTQERTVEGLEKMTEILDRMDRRHEKDKS